MNQEVELIFCVVRIKADVCQRNNALSILLCLTPCTLYINFMVFFKSICECFREQVGLKLFMKQINYHLLMHYKCCIMTEN